MPKLSPLDGETVMFICPGCGSKHVVRVKGASPWAWNGSADKPTFAPSIRTTSGHFSPGFSGSCWCTFNAEHPDDPTSFKCFSCHSYVTDGKIAFLADCSHALAGKTVEIPDWTG